MASTLSIEAASRQPLSTFRQALLSFYWLATNVLWSAVLLVTMPSQIKAAVGDTEKGSALGLALAAGAAISMVAAPAFGALSDRIRLPGGRRKPWVVIGTIGNVVSLLGLAFLIQPGNPDSVLPWVGAFLLVELFNNIATAPYAALIPDLVPPEQRGSASGWLGMMTILGTFIGGLIGFLIDPLGGITNVYYVLMGVMLLGMVVTIFGVKEPAVYTIRQFSWKEFLDGLVDPFKHSDFTWVFTTRLLVTMGVFTVQEFLQ